MAKTNWKVISYYDGNQEIKDILVDLITEKIKRNRKNEVENKEERGYNKSMSFDDDLPGLAG